jgi:hypothetical protein
VLRFIDLKEYLFRAFIAKIHLFITSQHKRSAGLCQAVVIEEAKYFMRPQHKLFLFFNFNFTTMSCTFSTPLMLHKIA